MAKETGRQENGQAVATIVVVTCVIVALASAATWFLFFNKGDNTDESNLYSSIKRYESEQMIDSLKESMNLYLDTYNPDAFHYSEVKSLRDQLLAEEADWMDTEKSMTIDGLRTFLMIHPDGFYRERANTCVDSLLALETVEEEEAIERHTPDSVYTDTTVVEPAEVAEPEEEHHHHVEDVEIDSIFG